MAESLASIACTRNEPAAGLRRGAAAITELPSEAQERSGDEHSFDVPDGQGRLRDRAASRLLAYGDRVPAAGALSALTLFVVVTNLLWVHSHRAGLPFDIDEAGYLQRAIRDGDALGHGGLTGLWDAYRLRDPQAPMLPISAGILHQVTGVGPTGLIAGEQLFVAIAVLSAFLIARRLDRRLLPALVVAGCVAALPAVTDGGRSFAFAVPAAALMTASLASQLAAGDFKRLRPALVWGVLLGLATLTRTVMLALLPALVVAVLLRLLLTRARPGQWANLAAGLLVALAVAATWYSATWRPVWDYLTGYGYGQQAGGYGAGHSLLSWGWWTHRITHAANTEIFFPLSLAAVVCSVAIASRLVRSDRRWAHEPWRVASGFLTTGWGTLTVVLVVDYLVLSSTQNTGSDFELPLLPAAAALLISGAAQAGRWTGRVALVVATVSAIFAFVAANGVLPGGPVRKHVELGRFDLVGYDDRGPLLFYSSRFVPPASAGSEPLLRRWQIANETLAGTLFLVASQHGTAAPVVFFAVQDPFVNTNSLALLAQERGISLPIGLLVPPAQAGESLAAQLQDPARGVPDAILIGSPSRDSAAAEFSPLSAKDMNRARAAARRDGFTQATAIRLPDGRSLELWWRTLR